MSKERFRNALASKLGEVITPELAAWLETNCFEHSVGILPGSSMHQKIERLENELCKVPQAECRITHHFAPYIYGRGIHVPKDVVVTGAVHKTENLVAVLKGRLAVMTDGDPIEVVAGDILTCKVGAKNAVVALEDSVWVNFFANPTNETDVDKLVEMVSESKACELMGGSNNRQLLEYAKWQKLED